MHLSAFSLRKMHLSATASPTPTRCSFRQLLMRMLPPRKIRPRSVEDMLDGIRSGICRAGSAESMLLHGTTFAGSGANLRCLAVKTPLRCVGWKGDRDLHATVFPHSPKQSRPQPPSVKDLLPGIRFPTSQLQMYAHVNHAVPAAKKASTCVRLDVTPFLHLSQAQLASKRIPKQRIRELMPNPAAVPALGVEVAAPIFSGAMSLAPPMLRQTSTARSHLLFVLIRQGLRGGPGLNA